MGNISGLLLGVVSIFLLVKIMNKPKLKYFNATEFGIWYPLINPDLLLMLDKFREAWGAPVVISSADGSIGRHGGGESQHNVDKWGDVRAIDVFPMIQTSTGLRYISNGTELMRAYQIAREVGFTGIGVYVDTKPGYMVHLDIRMGRTAGDPAKWSRVAGEYLDVSRAFV